MLAWIPSASARSWADSAAVERANSWYMAYRVSSPKALSTSSLTPPARVCSSTDTTVALPGLIFNS